MRVPTMSDGSRSGVNWMRRNDAADGAGQRLDRERLGQAGHALEEAVASGQQADEHPLDGPVLADDDLLDLEQHTFELCGGPVPALRPRKAPAGAEGVFDAYVAILR